MPSAAANERIERLRSSSKKGEQLFKESRHWILPVGCTRAREQDEMRESERAQFARELVGPITQGSHGKTRRTWLTLCKKDMKRKGGKETEVKERRRRRLGREMVQTGPDV